MIREQTKHRVTRLIAWALSIILATFVFYVMAGAVYGEPGTTYGIIHDTPLAPSASAGVTTPTPAATTEATSQPDYLLMYIALILCLLGILTMTVIHAVASR